MNNDQELGFQMLGSVLDKKSVRNAGIAVCGAASSLVTTMLALWDRSRRRLPSRAGWTRRRS